MAKKRASQFRSSVLPAFSVLQGAKIAKAAARKSTQSDIPVLIRPDRGKPVLLVPSRGGKMRAYDIRARKGRLPRIHFDTTALLKNPDFELIPIVSRVLSAGRLKMTIQDGHLVDKIARPLILIIRWGEISPPKPPTPPPPPPSLDQ